MSWILEILKGAYIKRLFIFLRKFTLLKHNFAVSSVALFNLSYAPCHFAVIFDIEVI